MRQDCGDSGRHAPNGDSLAVECATRPRGWTDKDGKAHFEVDVIAGRVPWLHHRNGPAAIETAIVDEELVSTDAPAPCATDEEGRLSGAVASTDPEIPFYSIPRQHLRWTRESRGRPLALFEGRAQPVPTTLWRGPPQAQTPHRAAPDRGARIGMNGTWGDLPSLQDRSPSRC